MKGQATATVKKERDLDRLQPGKPRVRDGWSETDMTRLSLKSLRHINRKRHRYATVLLSCGSVFAETHLQTPEIILFLHYFFSCWFQASIAFLYWRNIKSQIYPQWSISSIKSPPPKAPQLLKTAPPTGDQVLKHMSLWGRFPITLQVQSLPRAPLHHPQSWVMRIDRIGGESGAWVWLSDEGFCLAYVRPWTQSEAPPNKTKWERLEFVSHASCSAISHPFI